MTKKNAKIVLWSGLIISSILSVIFLLKIANYNGGPWSIGHANIYFGIPLFICTLLIFTSILDIIDTHSTIKNPGIAKGLSIFVFILWSILTVLFSNMLFANGITFFLPMLFLSILIMLFCFNNKLRNYPPYS